MLYRVCKQEGAISVVQGIGVGGFFFLSTTSNLPREGAFVNLKRGNNRYSRLNNNIASLRDCRVDEIDMILKVGRNGVGQRANTLLTRFFVHEHRKIRIQQSICFPYRGRDLEIIARRRGRL